MTWSWQNYCVGVIEHLAKQREFFTSDDVHKAIEIEPPHYNMMGAAFEAAKLRGYIKPTKRIEQSRRPEAKGRNIQIWESLLFRQPVLFDDIESKIPEGQMERRDKSRKPCTECRKLHSRRDAFGNITDRCESCARKDVVKSG